MKKSLKSDQSEESLETLKHQCQSMLRKLEFYGDAEDEDLNFLLDKLEDLVTRTELKIEKNKVLDCKQRQLPGGPMMTWGGKIE